MSSIGSGSVSDHFLFEDTAMVSSGSKVGVDIEANKMSAAAIARIVVAGREFLR